MIPSSRYQKNNHFVVLILLLNISTQSKINCKMDIKSKVIITGSLKWYWRAAALKLSMNGAK
jgi:hypothetical protein